MTPPGDPLRADAGVTLVELIVALALFALIAVAGFTLLDSVLRVRERTDGRLERLAEMQRAMQILTADFEQAAPGPLAFVGDAVVFRRSGAAAEAPDVTVGYVLLGDALTRVVGDASAGAAPQTLLPGVAALEWSFYAPGSGWAPTLPLAADGLPRRPTAVALDMAVVARNGAPSGRLRRVVALPAAP